MSIFYYLDHCRRSLGWYAGGDAFDSGAGGDFEEHIEIEIIIHVWNLIGGADR